MADIMLHDIAHQAEKQVQALVLPADIEQNMAPWVGKDLILGLGSLLPGRRNSFSSLPGS